MIAIWPAGPPKLTKPSWSQNRSASRKLTVAGREVGPWEGGSVVCAVTLGPLLEDHRSCARRCFHCRQEPFLFRGNLPSSLATPGALQVSWVRQLLRRDSGLLLWPWTVAVRASLRCQKLAAAPEATSKSGLFSSVSLCRGSGSLFAGPRARLPSAPGSDANSSARRKRTPHRGTPITFLFGPLRRVGPVRGPTGLVREPVEPPRLPALVLLPVAKLRTLCCRLARPLLQVWKRLLPSPSVGEPEPPAHVDSVRFARQVVHGFAQTSACSNAACVPRAAPERQSRRIRVAVAPPQLYPAKLPILAAQPHSLPAWLAVAAHPPSPRLAVPSAHVQAEELPLQQLAAPVIQRNPNTHSTGPRAAACTAGAGTRCHPGCVGATLVVTGGAVGSAVRTCPRRLCDHALLAAWCPFAALPCPPRHAVTTTTNNAEIVAHGSPGLDRSAYPGALSA